MQSALLRLAGTEALRRLADVSHTTRSTKVFLTHQAGKYDCGKQAVPSLLPASCVSTLRDEAGLSDPDRQPSLAVEAVELMEPMLSCHSNFGFVNTSSIWGRACCRDDIGRVLLQTGFCAARLVLS
mmetsp:Transcript_49207/g.115125  ORF Transcript_49207/g.115125 Transcript_49207/m.115125 type:complete len:126 (-) Transcript_49207:18-395(-)